MKKVTIKVIEEILGHILQMSTIGLVDVNLKDKEGTARMIIGDHVQYVNGELLANQLTIEMRLLHSFVTHILFSKIGRFDFISDRYLAIMRYILEQKPVNMLRLIMNYMWEASSKRHSSLPYGTILTQLFKHFRIPIHDDEPKRALRHTDVYNLATLRRMGFHKVNTEWTRRSERTEEGQPAEEPR